MDAVSNAQSVCGSTSGRRSYQEAQFDLLLPRQLLHKLFCERLALVLGLVLKFGFISVSPRWACYVGGKGTIKAAGFRRESG
jgi:hypothetical protein